MFLPPFSPRVKSLRLVPTLTPIPPAWRYTRSDASPKPQKDGRDKDSHFRCLVGNGISIPTCTIKLSHSCQVNIPFPWMGLVSMIFSQTCSNTFFLQNDDYGGDCELKKNIGWKEKNTQQNIFTRQKCFIFSMFIGVAINNVSIHYL